MNKILKKNLYNYKKSADYFTSQEVEVFQEPHSYVVCGFFVVKIGDSVCKKYGRKNFNTK